MLCIVATVATAAVVVRWWRDQRSSGDPLPAWLAAGTVVAWLAVVPDATDLASWRLPGRDVVTPLLFMATVPLLVAGVALELVRRSTSGRERAVHRAVEWITLTAGILVVYTALVAGLGQLVGGSGPTWFLVAATGAIALALEPARRHIHRLVDRLVYGSRDDPLALVQRIVDHVGSGTDDLLAPLAHDLMRELRVDAVAIDVVQPDEWQRVVSVGIPTTHHREVLLRHRDQVVGRLVVGWEHGPSLRTRDELVLTNLTGPMTLAVRWMQLANELRRSSVAIVVAREEERRRLRRDLHDGIGPTLTGISLGLRTTVRRLARSSPATEEVEGRSGCSTASPTKSTTSSSSSSRSSATSARRCSISSACSAPSPSSPASSTRTSTSNSTCHPTRCSCRRRSRWRRIASSPRRSRTSCATPAPSGAG